MVADLHEVVEKRLEEFQSAVASGVFCAGWAESFGKAWLSKVERTQQMIEELQKKFADLPAKPEAADFTKELGDIGRQLAGKAEQSELDRLQQDCSRKADLACVNALQSAHKAEVTRVSELSLLVSSKASQAELGRLSQLLEQKPHLAATEELLQLVEDNACGASREFVEDMATKLALHTEELKTAEIARFAFLNVLELLGVRFVPEHEKVVELIKGVAKHWDADKLSNSFASTWTPYDTMPKKSPSVTLSDAAEPLRVGGGYRLMEGQRSASLSGLGSRPLSASKRPSSASGLLSASSTPKKNFQDRIQGSRIAVREFQYP